MCVAFYTASKLADLSGFADPEADGRRHPGSSSTAVVAIPVAEDIREIRRIASTRG